MKKVRIIIGRLNCISVYKKGEPPSARHSGAIYMLTELSYFFSLFDTILYSPSMMRRAAIISPKRSAFCQPDIL